MHVNREKTGQGSAGAQQCSEAAVCEQGRNEIYRYDVYIYPLFLVRSSCTLATPL